MSEWKDFSKEKPQKNKKLVMSIKNTFYNSIVMIEGMFRKTGNGYEYLEEHFTHEKYRIDEYNEITWIYKKDLK